MHLDPMTVPHAIVSGTYSFVVPITPQAVNYVVTGLPGGLRMDTATHAIVGKPDAVGADKGTAHVTVKGQAETLAFDLVVEPLPALAQGSFAALVARDVDVTAEMGGFLTFTVSATGAVTGSLKVGQMTPITKAPGFKLETKTYPIKARLEVPLTGDPSLPTYTITRTGLPSLVLALSALDINAPGAGNVTGTLGIVGFSTPLAGRRLAWSTVSAAPYVASYTAAMVQPSVVVGTPDGAGYLTVKVVAATATATWSGQLADGTAYTGSSVLWDTGAGTAELPIWVTLNSSQGALAGLPVITPQSLPDLSTMAGNVSWRKKPQAARAYAAGFDLSLPLVGYRYLAPAAGNAVLGLPAPTVADPNNASIAFTDGSIEAVAQFDDLAQLFSISTSNKATFAPVATNPTLIKITSINTTLGTFVGSLKLTDPNQLPSPAPPTVTRDVAFSGVLLQGESPPTAIGYFLLPARPAMMGQTVKNTAITSGLVGF